MDSKAASLNTGFVLSLLFSVFFFFFLSDPQLLPRARAQRQNQLCVDSSPRPVFNVMALKEWLHVGENLFVYIHTILRVVLSASGEVGLLFERAVYPVLFYHHVLALAE